MHLIRLHCDACGAPLRVPARANFVACTFCSAQLAIRRTEGAITTEALEAIAEGTRKLATDVETIKLQNELERLDREWTMGIERDKVRGKDGHHSVPSAAGSLEGGVVLVIFGIFCAVAAASTGAPPVIPSIGLVFTGLVIVCWVSGGSKASAYGQARQSYESRRQAVLREIQARSTASGSAG